MNPNTGDSSLGGMASFGGGTMMGATASIKQGDTVFQRYTLQKVLGVGGMGVVWLAHDTKLDQPVALKFVPEALQHDGDAIHDLKVQTKLGLQLTHNNIVRVQGFEDDGGRLAAISMEYVDGATLGAMRLDQPAQVFEADSLHVYLLHILAALEYAHDDEKIVHRDLKPANVMVNSEDRVKVADFGIACSLRNSVSRVMSMPQKTGSGTLNYMSPQQLLGSPASISDDIYSLGATIFELMTGTPPFYSGDVAMQIREIAAPSMNQRRLDNGIDGEPIPQHWEDVVAAALAKEPGLRPCSVGEFRKGLQGQPFVRGSTSGSGGTSAGVRFAAPAPVAAAQPAALSMTVLGGSIAAVLAICGMLYAVSLPATPAKLEKPTPKLSVARYLGQEASATTFESGDTSPASKRNKWNDLVKEVRLTDYQEEPKLRELLLRAEARSDYWGRQEDAGKQQYLMNVQALKSAVDRAHADCEAKDMGAAAKAAVWNEILRKNLPLFTLADQGLEHAGLLEQARGEALAWKAKAVQETPAALPNEEQVFAKSHAATWTAEGKKQMMKSVQTALNQRGHPMDRQDGTWNQSTFDALVAWQEEEKLPVTGVLDVLSLTKLNLQFMQEPAAPKVVQAAGPLRSNTGGSSNNNNSYSRPASSGGSPSWGDVIKAKVLTTNPGSMPGPPMPFR